MLDCIYFLSIFSEITIPIPQQLFSQHSYYYTCQCKTPGYGFENCTQTSESADSINFGYTYCQIDPKTVTINGGNDNSATPLIFIDHVAYGSFLAPPGKPDDGCQDYYAQDIDKVRSYSFF